MLRAILGGSFDPVHLGHLSIAEHLLDEALADYLMVIPAWLSPHKFESSAEPTDRLAMVRLAFAGRPSVKVDDREIIRGSVSYTVETLEELAAEFPADRLRLVIGADNLTGFADWLAPDRIQEIAEIVVYPRDGVAPTTEVLRRSGLDIERVIPVTGFHHPVSSTTVRAMLGRGILPDAQLPRAVADYIADHRLYLKNFPG